MRALRQKLNKAKDCLLQASFGQARKKIGENGESIAAAIVQAAGAQILAKNFRITGGEIDLIIDDHGTVAFVEVRVRQNNRFGGAAASITHSKRRKIILTANAWLQQAPATLRQKPCRFDAVLLTDLTTQSGEWIKHAFTADDA